MKLSELVKVILGFEFISVIHENELYSGRACDIGRKLTEEQLESYTVNYFYSQPRAIFIKVSKGGK